MRSYVFDTNIVSYIIRNEGWIQPYLRTIYLPTNTFIACPVVHYEVQRGLLVRDARSQMMRFERLFARFSWQEYIREDWQLAADLWQHHQAIGKPIADADLLIAVFTIRQQATLVTSNHKDFVATGVKLEVWHPEK